MPCLLIVTPQNEFLCHQLTSDKTTIGRAKDQDICLDSTHVSRQHATLCKRDNNTYWLEPQSKTNTLVINAQNINEAQRLKSGELVEIGDFRLCLDEQQNNPKQNFAMLVGHTQPYTNKIFPLPQGTTSLGRGNNNSLIFDHLSVSRQHVNIEVKGSVCEVTCSQEKNLILVNNTSCKQSVLKSNDLLKIGDLQFRFRTSEQEKTNRKRKTASLWNSQGHWLLWCIAIGLFLSGGYIKIQTQKAQQVKEESVHNLQNYEAKLDFLDNEAKTAMQSQQWENAIVQYQSILKLDPFNTTVRQKINRAQNNVSDLAQIKLCEEANQKHYYRQCLRALKKLSDNSYYQDQADQIKTQIRAARKRRQH